MKIIFGGLFVVLVTCSVEVFANVDHSMLKQNTYEIRIKNNKPGASVNLVNPQPIDVQSNVTTEANLLLASGNDQGIMLVRVTSSESLLVEPKLGELQFLLTTPGPYKIPLMLNATAPGRHYINLHITTDIADQKSSRVLIAIVQAGTAITEKTAQKSYSISNDNNQTKMLSLPAQETVIGN